ncbi:MAG: hypothetical protein IJ646_08475 [Clostridia bacterium]|nr:hypothetical protein [Clostridia bacterium]
MQKTFDTACRILPSLSKEELRRLQERIVELLRGEDDDLVAVASEARLEAELDAALADFDRGEGYPAEEMSARIRARFGW